MNEILSFSQFEEYVIPSFQVRNGSARFKEFSNSAYDCYRGTVAQLGEKSRKLGSERSLVNESLECIFDYYDFLGVSLEKFTQPQVFFLNPRPNWKKIFNNEIEKNTYTDLGYYSWKGGLAITQLKPNDPRLRLVLTHELFHSTGLTFFTPTICTKPNYKRIEENAKCGYMSVVKGSLKGLTLEEGVTHFASKQILNEEIYIESQNIDSKYIQAALLIKDIINCGGNLMYKFLLQARLPGAKNMRELVQYLEFLFGGQDINSQTISDTAKKPRTIFSQLINLEFNAEKIQNFRDMLKIRHDSHVVTKVRMDKIFQAWWRALSNSNNFTPIAAKALLVPELKSAYRRWLVEILNQNYSDPNYQSPANIETIADTWIRAHLEQAPPQAISSIVGNVINRKG